MARSSHAAYSRVVGTSILLVLILASWARPVNSQDVGETSPATEITPESTPEVFFTETPEDTLTPDSPPVELIVTEKTSTPISTSTQELKPDERLNYPHVKNQLVVKYKPGASPPKLLSSRTRGMQTESIDALDVVIHEVPPDQLASLLAQLSSDPNVEWVEPNFQIALLETIPNDPAFELQWWLNRIQAPLAWDYSTGSTAITIAIVDSGIDYSHPDLAGKIIGGKDIVNDDAIAEDENGHGTAVAGIAAAITNNAEGISGVSWGARILPVKVTGADGLGTYEATAAGIVYAVDAGAAVINLSLGGSAPSQLLLDAVTYASANGVVVVAASGNNGSQNVLYPARYNQTIAVASTDYNNQVSGFSNYGPEVDIAAPGQSIYSTTLGGLYISRTGTSMAAPLVAGAAAVLLSLPGNNAPSLVRQQILGTALDIAPTGVDYHSGHGLLQLNRAIRQALGLQEPTPTQGIVEPTLTATSPYILPPLAPTLTGFPTSLPIPTQGGTVSLLKSTLTQTPLVTFSPSDLLDIGKTHTPTAMQSNALRAEINWNVLLPIMAIILVVFGCGLLVYVFRLRKNR